VRDINDAIRELGQMVAVHTGTSSSTFTKLTVLQEAVRVITDLENRLRGISGNGQRNVAIRSVSLHDCCMILSSVFRASSTRCCLWCILLRDAVLHALRNGYCSEGLMGLGLRLGSRPL